MAALRGIQCRCGDEINLTMMGHGTSNNFVFSKASGRNRTISADDLRDALGAAAVECCCKINVVVFACHSGSLMDELFEEEHVNSVYVSSLDGQCSHSSGFFENETTYVDEGDWMKGFNHDLALVRSASSMADAFEQAAETARENTPIDFVRVETPVGWRRGDHEVVAHIKSAPRRHRGRWRAEVTYHKPHWMRGKTEYIYFAGEPPERYRRCNWIRDTASFNAPSDDVTFTGPTAKTDAPSERIVAHVLAGNRSYLTIHTVSPKWQFCKQQKLRYDNRDQINRNLARCNWIDQTVSVTDPGSETHTDAPINPATPTFRMRFHVESYDERSGELRGRPQNVDGTDNSHWLDSYRRIQIPPGERARMRGIRRCNNIFLDVTMSDQGDQPPTGSNIRRVHRDQVNGYSYDIALNQPFQPSKTIVNTVVPEATFTNVGETTMDFNVEVAIGKQTDQDWLDSWLAGRYVPSGILWTNQQEVKKVEAAQSVDVKFNHYRYVPETDYIMAFAVRSEQDEVSRNDTARIDFRFNQRVPSGVQEGLVYTAKGTGRTTGHVITLSIYNPLDTAVVLEIGPYIVPGHNGHQGYVIPGIYTVIVPSGESATTLLYGFCINLGKPPLADQTDAPGIQSWISTDNMSPIVLAGESPPATSSAFQPTQRKKVENTLIPTVPGTSDEFPWTIDISEFPNDVAPFIFNATEAISTSYEELYDLDQITTPFESDLFKEKDAVVQHTLWEYTEALEGGNYLFEDFKKNAVKEAESVLGQPLFQSPITVQKDVNNGVTSFWDSFEAVGVHAKVLKKG